MSEKVDVKGHRGFSTIDMEAYERIQSLGFAAQTTAPEEELVLVACAVWAVSKGTWISTGDHDIGGVWTSVGFYYEYEECDPKRDWQVAGYDNVHDRWRPAVGFNVIGWQALPGSAL